jgi:hypothetical protein
MFFRVAGLEGMDTISYRRDGNGRIDGVTSSARMNGATLTVLSEELPVVMNHGPDGSPPDAADLFAAWQVAAAQKVVVSALADSMSWAEMQPLVEAEIPARLARGQHDLMRVMVEGSAHDALLIDLGGVSVAISRDIALTFSVAATPAFPARTLELAPVEKPS